MTDSPSGATYVAKTIRDFIGGCAEEWDWDDFTSCPLSDERLDSIRRRAAAVELPCEPEDLLTLEGLAVEAEELARG
jgi:hypothetical protein